MRNWSRDGVGKEGKRMIRELEGKGNTGRKEVKEIEEKGRTGGKEGKEKRRVCCTVP